MGLVKNLKNVTVKKIILSVFLVFIGILSRTLFSKGFDNPILPVFGNNFEIVTVIGVLAGYFIGGAWGWVVPLGVVAISDRILGNNSTIIIFTWTGFVIPSVLGGLLRRWLSASGQPPQNKNRLIKILGGGVGGSLLSVIIFYIWTNFGVWLTGFGFKMYPMTFQGLMKCYYMALPFLLNQLKSAFIFGGLAFGAISFISWLWSIPLKAFSPAGSTSRD